MGLVPTGWQWSLPIRGTFRRFQTGDDRACFEHSSRQDDLWSLSESERLCFLQSGEWYLRLCLSASTWTNNQDAELKAYEPSHAWRGNLSRSLLAGREQLIFCLEPEHEVEGVAQGAAPRGQFPAAGLAARAQALHVQLETEKRAIARDLPREGGSREGR